MTTQHTPTLEQGDYPNDAAAVYCGSELIAICEGTASYTEEQWAEHIVRAVKSHAKLVELLKEPIQPLAGSDSALAIRIKQALKEAGEA